MIRLLYNFLLLMAAIDGLASIIAAVYMFKMRQRFGYYLALAFTGVAVEASLAVITVGLGPGPSRLVPWIIVVRILARLFKTVTLVMLPLYLLGYLNGDKPEVMKDDPE